MKLWGYIIAIGAFIGTIMGALSRAKASGKKEHADDTKLASMQNEVSAARIRRDVSQKSKGTVRKSARKRYSRRKK